MADNEEENEEDDVKLSSNLEEDAIGEPQDDPDALYEPEKILHKPFTPIEVSNFQIIRYCLPPRCFFTYYQLVLDRLLKKSISKMERELEISSFTKKVRTAFNLSCSYERMELFKGLKKKYKNSYSNVVNVSLDTVDSILEEYQKPIMPADVPYARRKQKKYTE